VPKKLREMFGSSLMTRYERVSFEHSEDQIFAADLPELLAPGHPLVSVLAEIVNDDFGCSLGQGIVLSGDRSSVDYVLVTVLATTEGNSSTVTTSAVTATGDRQQVNPGLYADLATGATPESHESEEKFDRGAIFVSNCRSFGGNGFRRMPRHPA